MGFQSQFGSEGEEEEEALSPEACYECKINGDLGKKGRHRRNAGDNELKVRLRSGNLAVFMLLFLQLLSTKANTCWYLCFVSTSEIAQGCYKYIQTS